jgi:protein ImuB
MTFSIDKPVVCVYLPRFELVVAAAGARALAGQAVAIAPSNAGTPVLGEVSGRAQAQGVRSGMRLGEALTLCPQLQLVPGDPLTVKQAWEETSRALEGIGARIELARPGVAFFGRVSGAGGFEVAGVASALS